MDNTDIIVRSIPPPVDERPARASTSRVTTNSGCLRSKQVYFAALEKSVRRSREFVRAVCLCWQYHEEQIDLAVQLVSELAANAVTASDSDKVRSTGLKRIGVRLLDLEDSLVIEVWDTSPEPPVLVRPSADVEHGRGLQIVDALSIRWGHYDVGSGGKVVWCQLGHDEAPTTVANEQAAGRRLLGALLTHAWDK